MAGYSGTPLIKKLGIKDAMRVYFMNTPENYDKLLGPLPIGVHVIQGSRPEGQTTDFIHAFFYEKDIFDNMLPGLMNSITADGMIWISWPKKASKVPTTMTEGIIRDIALPMGLVDVKVCAVDDIWSGLKLVIRKELRQNHK